MHHHIAKLLVILLFVSLAAEVGWCEPPPLPRASEVGQSVETVKDRHWRSEDAIRLTMSNIKEYGGRMFDDFDGSLELNWQLLRPDPTHISLAKHPGKLTISTQNGTIHLKRNLPKAKNIVLLDNPFPAAQGFVVTTCLDGFRPREPFQQAGLIVYNDDDNYLKWVIEQTTSGGVPSRVAWNLLREDNGSSTMAKPLVTHDMTKKVWLRLTLRKGQYEYASSTDGKAWTVHGELPWGDGPPKRIGLLAKNGGARAADSVDARFDFFEIRPLTPAERRAEPLSATRPKESSKADYPYPPLPKPEEPSKADYPSAAKPKEPAASHSDRIESETSRHTVVYRLETADSKTVMSAMQEALKEYPDARVQIIPPKGDLLVVGPPAAHAVIRETLGRLERKLPEADEETTIRLYDGFDGNFALNWEPVRPDKAHVSLEKNPGKLTITTQRGGIYGSVGPSAKNFYLIRNPLAEDGDFVLTTCIESFKPTLSWQQAGLLVYDDDDNYLKCDVEWSKSAVQFRYIRETDGEPVNEMDQSGVDQEQVWIRITKRGKSYERAYSSDGKKFVSAGEGDWGDGSPKWIGIFAKNGPNVSDGIDAVFDFFEFRSLTPAEKDRFSVAQPAVVPKTKPEEADIAASIVSAIQAADDAPAEEKPWLKEKAWPALVQPRSLEVQPGEGGLSRLLKQRYNAAQDELRERYNFWLQGIGTLDQVYAAAGRAIEARLDVVDPAADHLTILREKIEFAECVERQAGDMRRSARQAIDEACARYFRLDAEIELLRAGGKQIPEGSGPSNISAAR